MNQEHLCIGLIYGSVILALLWAAINAWAVVSVDVLNPQTPQNEQEQLIENSQIEQVQKIGLIIKKGARSFLKAEYTVMAVFIVLFGAVVFFLVDFLGSNDGVVFYATSAFVIGSFTSMLCGFIGMSIAVEANYRTTYKATLSLAEAYQIAFRSGCVMGFSSTGIALGVLLSVLLVFVKIYEPVDKIGTTRSWGVLMEFLAGYGLGGSAMALFGRVGGGIYTKAADVGADLVGKLENNFPEDDPRNAATIADNVGDNVGDIAGMGSDLFGSLAESTCAALVVIVHVQDLVNHKTSIYAPLLISAIGIVCCFLTSVYGIYLYQVDNIKKIQSALNQQLIISTILTLLALISITYTFPKSWVQLSADEKNVTVYDYYVYICAAMGLVSGCLIGISTDYYTSDSHKPVRELSQSCTYGAAINIIYGLALGYLSNVIPVLLIAVTLITSVCLLDMLGVALAAIGMLSTLSIGLAIDAYGPISDNAGGICEMAQLGSDIRAKTDALDAAGNTTAAVGKGFAIGSATLVALALYGAFITRAEDKQNNHPFGLAQIAIKNPWIFGTLLIGAMLPYAFSALTMKSVGKAAEQMVAVVRKQLQNEDIREGKVDPDYEECVIVSTQASIREMIAPGLLVMLTPLFFGILFHPILVAGLLPGAVVSGVQLAISMSNSGGAWDNCKKHIASGTYVNSNGEPRGKGSDEHQAAIVGDTVGDPLKDTSGPSLNILIKLMAIISLVFAGGFDKTSLLADWLNIHQLT